MINNYISLSEDDIRSKVVYEWLKDCGLKESNIIIEYSINLRIGRGIKNINSRTDVLVKSDLGQNLLIIEVKRPNHSLKDIDGEQALSYARALAEGGIAPFTILTNGKDVKIYDSVTGEEIIGNIISNTHPYVKNGFFVSGDALQAKAEALEYLVSYSKENLLIFCKAQIEYRMKLLKSNELFSGKKYIPQLYVERSKAKKDLEDKLFNKDDPKQIVLVIGPPQHGKTCFLCNTVESFINNEIPVLFYPAISLKKGLLNEIQDDFEWFFGEQSSQAHLINRLSNIIKKIGKKFVIFVDGWNEMLGHALTINDECQRMQNSHIKFVLSTTSPSLTRLLQDEAGNLTFIAEETKLNNSVIRNLTTKPLINSAGFGLVQIGAFDKKELKEGKSFHEQAYNTKFLYENNLSQDPFYLRVASEIYANSVIPIFATRTQLLKEGLYRKGRRRGISEIDLITNLNHVAGIIIEKDAPFCCIDLPGNLHSEKVLSRWIESAIFIRLYEKEIPEIDFYYTHEKNYSVAILNRRLHERLDSSDDQTIQSELQYMFNTESGKNALRWFLSCPEYSQILKNVFKSLISKNLKDYGILRILTDAIFQQVEKNSDISANWLEENITDVIKNQIDKDKFYDDLASLIYSFLKSLDIKTERDKYEFWIRLLVKYDRINKELNIEESFICQYFGTEEMQRGHYNEEIPGNFDVNFFEKLTLDEDFNIAYNAISILNYLSYTFTLKKLPFIYNYYQQNNRNGIDEIIESICNNALKVLSDYYYGEMCPGLLYHYPENDTIEYEFSEQKELWWPILKLLDPKSDLYKRIIDLLKSLLDYIEGDLTLLKHLPSNDPNQLIIDFRYDQLLLK